MHYCKCWEKHSMRQTQSTKHIWLINRVSTIYIVKLITNLSIHWSFYWQTKHIMWWLCIRFMLHNMIQFTMVTDTIHITFTTLRKHRNLINLLLFSHTIYTILPIVAVPTNSKSHRNCILKQPIRRNSVITLLMIIPLWSDWFGPPKFHALAQLILMQLSNNTIYSWPTKLLHQTANFTDTTLQHARHIS